MNQEENNNQENEQLGDISKPLLYNGFSFTEGGKYRQGEIKILHHKDLCCPFCSHGEEFIVKYRRDNLAFNIVSEVLSLGCPSCFEKPVFVRSGIGSTMDVFEKQKENILDLANKMVEFYKRNSCDFICV
jgi:hypothetical protein